RLRPSPRAWGLGSSAIAFAQYCPSIPTCVGLGRPAGGQTSATAVHPHVRGAWDGVRQTAPVLGRPSPRAWGLDFPTCTNFRRYRFATKHIEATRTPVATPSLSVVNLMVRAIPSATYVQAPSATRYIAAAPTSLHSTPMAAPPLPPPWRLIA